MRKTLVVLVLVALAGAAGAYYYFYQPFGPQTALETVLPADTLGVVRVCELKKQIERFSASRMGQALGGIDIGALLNALEAPPAEQEKILQSVQDFKTAINSTWFDTLFGQDIALALLNLSFDLQQLITGDLQPFTEAMAVVARPKQPTRVLESLNSMFAQQLSVQTQAFQQWEINQFNLENGQPVYYALTNGLLIAGLSPMPVQRCLEQSLEPTSLLQTPAYQRHGGSLFKAGQTDLLAFADGERLLTLIGEAVNREAENDPDMMGLIKTQLERMQGLESFHLAQYDDGGPLVRSKTIIGINRAKLSPSLTRSFGIQPSDNPTLKHAPLNTLLYSWQNNFDLKLYWQEIQQYPEMTPEVVAQFKQTFAMKTGMDLDTVLEALGTQAGLLINDLKMGGMFPIPELALFIEVKQPEIIDQLIARQVNPMNMPQQQETYQGAELHSIMLPLGANLSPAYTYSEGFYTLAVNLDMLKRMLDASGAGNLGAHPNFTALGSGLTEKNNQVFYMHFEGLVAKARELINWAMAWAGMAKPDEVRKAKQIVQLGVNPLLDGLSMIKAVGGRSYIEEEKITSEMHVLLDR